MLDPYTESAKTLTLVAIIIQAVFLIIGVLIIMFFGIAEVATSSSTVTAYYSNGTVHKAVVVSSPPAMYGPLSILILITVVIALGLLWILLDYFLVYRKISLEKIEEASTSSIVLGIIQLIFGGLIPGILLILAYIKIRNSIDRKIYMSQGNKGFPP